ncbi:MAG: hypothetical protein KGL39_30485 [Patescibacteria group bacterium]|nr:hypothetical protein [Patescibacteria group bacterium]
MPNLIIRFINSPGIISTLIDWETDSLFCHTEALSRDGQHWIGAHAGTGVQARPLDWTTTTRDYRYALEVTEEQYEAAMAFLESKIGTPYDYLDIVGLLFKFRVHDPKQLICSAFMMEFLAAAGIQPLNCLPDFDYLITPETLHLSPIFIGKRFLPLPEVA